MGEPDYKNNNIAIIVLGNLHFLFLFRIFLCKFFLIGAWEPFSSSRRQCQNFVRSFLGCIDAGFSNQVLMFHCFSRTTTHLYTARFCVVWLRFQLLHRFLVEIFWVVFPDFLTSYSNSYIVPNSRGWLTIVFGKSI